VRVPSYSGKCTNAFNATCLCSFGSSAAGVHVEAVRLLIPTLLQEVFRSMHSEGKRIRRMEEKAKTKPSQAKLCGQMVPRSGTSGRAARPFRTPYLLYLPGTRGRHYRRADILPHDYKSSAMHVRIHSQLQSSMHTPYSAST